MFKGFTECSQVDKITLIKLCCLCFCDVAYSAGAINRLISAYNKCTKMVYGFKSFCIVTQMLL